MNTIEALQGLYEKLGGDAENVAELTTIPEMVDAITSKVESGGGGGGDLPEVTSADNGKALAVVDGEWDTQDVFEAVFNITGYAPPYEVTCNKTFAEIIQAHKSGKNVKFRIIASDGNEWEAFSVSFCEDEEELNWVDIFFISASSNADPQESPKIYYLYIDEEDTIFNLFRVRLDDKVIFDLDNGVYEMTAYGFTPQKTPSFSFLKEPNLNVMATEIVNQVLYTFALPDKMTRFINSEECVVFGGYCYNASDARIYREIIVHPDYSITYADYTATLTPVTP